jgi:anti-sigma-K factor RskA
MMAYSEDHIALAAEYALGTLDADERAQVETMMAVDQEFTAIVQAWEFRLGVLNQMVGSVEPRPIVWENIRRAVGHAEPQAPLVLPEAPPSPPTLVAANDAYEAGMAQAPAPVADNSNVIQLAGRARRWRNIASVTSALAAALVVMLAMQVYQPDMLPNGIRPKPRIQTVEVKAPPPPSAAQYVALLQKDAGSPAFILTVDAATRNFTVRKVGAQPEAGKSYELWIVSDKLQRPRSLGVIGGNDFTARPVLSGYAPDVVNEATYAVSVEPPGGSPSGAPTGPVVFSGKLIETVPPGAAPAAPASPR